MLLGEKSIAGSGGRVCCSSGEGAACVCRAERPGRKGRRGGGRAQERRMGRDQWKREMCGAGGERKLQ